MQNTLQNTMSIMKNTREVHCKIQKIQLVVLCTIQKYNEKGILNQFQKYNKEYNVQYLRKFTKTTVRK